MGVQGVVWHGAQHDPSRISARVDGFTTTNVSCFVLLCVVVGAVVVWLLFRSLRGVHTLLPLTTVGWKKQAVTIVVRDAFRLFAARGRYRCVRHFSLLCVCFCFVCLFSRTVVCECYVLNPC